VRIEAHASPENLSELDAGEARQRVAAPLREGFLSAELELAREVVQFGGHHA